MQTKDSSVLSCFNSYVQDLERSLCGFYPACGSARVCPPAKTQEVLQPVFGSGGSGQTCMSNTHGAFLFLLVSYYLIGLRRSGTRCAADEGRSRLFVWEVGRWTTEDDVQRLAAVSSECGRKVHKPKACASYLRSSFVRCVQQNYRQSMYLLSAPSFCPARSGTPLTAVLRRWLVHGMDSVVEEEGG